MFNSKALNDKKNLLSDTVQHQLELATDSLLLEHCWM